MHSTMKRFVVGGRRSPTNLEKTKELKEKLERFAEKKKESVLALDKVLLEKKVLENWDSEEEPDVEDIQELVKQANFLELDCSREGFAKARENLKKTETLLGINMRKSNVKVREVLEEGEVMKEWEIEFQPDEDDPDVVITMTFADPVVVVGGYVVFYDLVQTISGKRGVKGLGVNFQSL